MIHPRFKSFAQALLPHFVAAWLDPFQETIEREAKAAAAEAKEGHWTLDAGAGEARHRRYFSRGRYMALDSGVGNPDWDYSHLDVLGDIQTLPLRPESIHSILCFVVLEHAKDPKRVLAEFARVLKPGGRLFMIVPFLWEEHQAPNDYARFTRYGIRLLMTDLPLRIETAEPIGGFFWVCARRCVALLGFLQKGWRWLLFFPLAPIFGLALPVALYFMDRMDRKQEYSLGFRIRAIKEGNYSG